MQNKKQKLSVYVKCDHGDGSIDYEVLSDFPIFKKTLTDVTVHETEIDLAKTNKITVRLSNKIGSTGHLVIEKINLGGTDLRNLWATSLYLKQPDNQLIPYTSEYMGIPGDYVIKIRQNALVQNYVTWLLSVCKPNEKS
jgi:hypothetical protein